MWAIQLDYGGFITPNTLKGPTIIGKHLEIQSHWAGSVRKGKFKGYNTRFQSFLKKIYGTVEMQQRNPSGFLVPIYL